MESSDPLSQNGNPGGFETNSNTAVPHLWDVRDEICEGEVVLGGSTPAPSSLHILRHWGQLGQAERQDAHNFPFRGWDLA